MYLVQAEQDGVNSIMVSIDTVNHDILSNKLNTFNLSIQTIDLFKDHLTARIQAVKIMGMESLFLTMKPLCIYKRAPKSK